MRSRSRLVRFLVAAWALVAGRRARKRMEAEEETERERREQEIEQAVEDLESTDGPRPGDPIAPESARREESERVEERNEKIRRRRAEPPPTKERSVETHPGSELVAVVALLAAALAAGAFAVFYVVYPDTQLLGLTLGLSLVGFAVACIVAGKRIVPQEKAVEEYHYFGDEENQRDVEAIVEEAGEGISRRKLIGGAAGVAGVTLGAAVALPVASLGPNVGEKIYATPWKPGRRVVDEEGALVPAESIVPATFVTAFPEGASRSEVGAPILLLRFDPAELKLPSGIDAPEGIVAYSKICTHAGCAVSMYREPLYEPTAPKPALVCPCHFSTFDPRTGGEVVFGPASRPLPQLPLRIASDGVLEAAGEMIGSVGPTYGGSRLAPDRDVKPPEPGAERG